MSCCDESKTKQEGAQANGLMGLITGPRRWWLFGALGIAAGLTFGWEQLVLFGIAPILISLLPCLVMCGLGLCMMKCKDKKGEASPANAQQSSVDAAGSAATQAGTASQQGPRAIALEKSA